MKCERAQDLLLAGPDEQLPAGMCNALQAHPAACPSCRRERERVAQLEQTLISWVAAAPLASVDATRRQLGAPRTRWQTLLRRATGATRRLAVTLTLRCAVVLALVLAVVGLGASLGVPLARTLVHAALRPFGGEAATLPVLPIAGDRVWVEAVTPASETRLASTPTFQLRLGYTLVTAPEAMVSVRLAAHPEAQTRYFTAPVRVVAGTNRASVRFTVDDARARQLLAVGEVQLEVTMRAVVPTGEAPLLARTTYGRWVLP